MRLSSAWKENYGQEESYKNLKKNYFVNYIETMLKYYAGSFYVRKIS